ncbi:MAG: hypothetical protein WDN24_06325 [Sphingomonas sp.]
MAEQLGAPVPRTLAIPRRMAPFAFGRTTGSFETWIRTCPREPQPGRFTTAKGWVDPYRLLADEDQADEIASVLAQAAIPAAWSGAAIVGVDGALIVEGRKGEGDAFMLGTALPQDLPEPSPGETLPRCMPISPTNWARYASNGYMTARGHGSSSCMSVRRAPVPVRWSRAMPKDGIVFRSSGALPSFAVSSPISPVRPV